MPETSELQNTSNKLVLVVEDDLDLRDVIARTLTRAGYRVQAAANGHEALERVACEMPSLILLDMHMPQMNGWEFARQFRALYDDGVPLIVLTAAIVAQQTAREIGAQAALDKPFRIHALLKMVEQFCGPP